MNLKKVPLFIFNDEIIDQRVHSLYEAVNDRFSQIHDESVERFSELL
jgi:hypothetical protein